MKFYEKGLIIGAALGVGVFLGAAFSQTPRLASGLVRIPYTVDSVFVRHASDGSSTVDIYSTSYNHNRTEIHRTLFFYRSRDRDLTPLESEMSY